MNAGGEKMRQVWFKTQMHAAPGSTNVPVVLLFCFFAIVLLLSSGCASLLWGVPKADFFHDPGFAYPNVNITFDASPSTSEKDAIVQYAWQFGDGTTGSGKVVSHTFASPGYFAVTLKVTTEHGQQASAQRTIHVADAIVVPGNFSSIQAAIDAASDGDTIVVLSGSYSENINFLGKAITVQSTDPSDPTVVDATIIEGTNIDRSIVTFSRGETGASMLAGFTIRRKSPYEPYSGGGIYVREADPTIRNNHIVGNTAFFSGGGIYLVDSRATIVGNRISNNEANQGGGIAAEGYVFFPTIANNVFENNVAAGGGAIHLSSMSPGNEPEGAFPTSLSSNTFTGNSATIWGGGAVYVGYDCKLKLDDPDSNVYSGNDPDDIFYEVPP